MKDYKYCIVLNKTELYEVIDALFLASREWGEPSRSVVAAISLKIRGQIDDKQAAEKCDNVVKNVLIGK